VETIASLFVGPLVTQLIFLGHAIVRCLVARRLGLEVARVRVGWGPKLWTHRTRRGALVELRLLPPLAMVAIRGHDPAAEEPSYRALYTLRDLGKCVLLTLVTPAYYVCLTALPLFAIGAIAGWPEAVTPSPMIVGHVESDGRADLAGVELATRSLPTGRPARSVGHAHSVRAAASRQRECECAIV
jgi:membrane-associated protease RseP (regulator of RpoE activity)